MGFDPSEERDAQGRWTAGGGDMFGKNNLNMADLHARGITTTRWNLRDPAKMTNSEINKEADKLHKAADQVRADMMQQGRGYEKPSETRTKTDALSLRHIAIANRKDELRYETNQRWPNLWPQHLPPKNQSFTIGRRPRVKKL